MPSPLPSISEGAELRRRLTVPLCFALSLLTPLCAADLQMYEAVEAHMGTLVRIQLYAANAAQADRALHNAFARIGQLDDALSDYKPDSELNRLCRAAVKQPVKLSRDLFDVLSAAQAVAEETDGSFDVTLGPVIRLWRQARRDHRPPSDAALQEAATRTGYRKLHLDAANRTAILDEPDMQLDLGGIAKGFAADAALAVLKASGIQSALVAMSGDLAFSDPPPGRAGWRIGVNGAVLELRNTAVSTSGDVEQHLDMGGKRYSHIVDPRTRMGLTAPIKVSVMARRGMEADALSTAISVLGEQRGLTLLGKHPGTAALIVLGEGDNALLVKSPGWPAAR